MKLASFFAPLTFVLITSCYSYQAFDPESFVAEVTANNNAISSKINNARSQGDDMEVVRRSRSSSVDQNENKNSFQKSPIAVTAEANAIAASQNGPASTSLSLKNIILPKEFYRLDHHGTMYKIEAKKWEGDTLHAIVKGKPKKELKFHENEISDLKIRKFSKGKSDMMTIAAYALGGVGLFILLK